MKRLKKKIKKMAEKGATSTGCSQILIDYKDRLGKVGGFFNLRPKL